MGVIVELFFYFLEGQLVLETYFKLRVTVIAGVLHHGTCYTCFKSFIFVMLNIYPGRHNIPIFILCYTWKEISFITKTLRISTKTVEQNRNPCTFA